MNESGHQFRRYVRRMVGRQIRYQALCECGWWGHLSGDEDGAWAEYCEHAERNLPTWDDYIANAPTQGRKVEQLLTGQEP